MVTGPTGEEKEGGLKPPLRRAKAPASDPSATAGQAAAATNSCGADLVEWDEFFACLLVDSGVRNDPCAPEDFQF